MQVGINIGENRHYELREALLIYHSDNHRNWNRGGSFVTHHPITSVKEKRPQLGPAKPLTESFLRSLVRSLGSSIPAEFLPENILARTDQMLAWWTPAQPRGHVFREYGGDTVRRQWQNLPAAPAGLAHRRWWPLGAGAQRKSAPRT